MLSCLACFLILSGCNEEEVQEPQNPEPEIEDVDDSEESQEPQDETDSVYRPLPSEDYEKLWPDAKKLVWVVSLGAIINVDPEIYKQFNDLLLEKGTDFVVEFIGMDVGDAENYQTEIKNMKATGEQVDLLFTGFGSDTIQTNFEAVDNDLLDPLDPYLQTEEGQKLFNQFDKKTWERASIEGTNYGLYNDPILSYSIYLFINDEVANTYNIQLPDELDLAQLEGMLQLVSDKSHDDLVPLYIEFQPEYFKELSGYDFLENGIAAGYDDNGNPYVLNPFEQANIISLMETLAHYSNQGYLRMYEEEDIETREMIENGQFLAIASSASPLNYLDGVLDMGNYNLQVVGYKLVDTFVVHLPNAIHGVTSWSEHKDEAFKLLMLLNTDSDLSNLLYHGIEGKHYTLVEGKIVPGEGEQRVPGFHSPANEMLTHPIGNEPINKEEVYREWNKNFQMSPIAGFTLDDANISTELNAVKQIYDKYQGLWWGDEQDVANQLAKANEELREVGLDKVLDEINQQLQDWWKAKN